MDGEAYRRAVRRPGGGNVRGLVAVAAAAAAVTAVVAHGPNTTLAYAQVHHIGAVVSVAQGGDWLLPRCATRGLFHKPPLAIWAGAAAVKATGSYDNLTFRLPTVLAFFAVALMVFLLGRRWYTPRVGVLAACLWATSLHMSKVSYLALTDMMFAAWVTGSIFCADRLLFHRRGVRRRWAWAIGLWITMVLGAMTKGWGLVNAALVGGTVAVASGIGPGFRMPPGLEGVRRKAGGLVRLVLRRWRAAAGALYVPWGLAVLLAVIGPLIAAMVLSGGEEFHDLVYKEVWQRLTGTGEAPPRATTVPAVFQLLYYQFPTSVFAVGAVFLARRRDWCSRRGLLLPASWILAVLAPFSLSHGFRPDYLLPCYAAMALMGAWTVDRLARLGLKPNRRRSVVRHVFAAAPVVLGAVLVLVPAAYALSAHGGWAIARAFRDPQTLDGPTRWLLAATSLVGVAVIVLAVHASLTWRIYRLGHLAAVASLGLILLYTHTLSEHARWLDGEQAVRFTKEVKRIVGNGPVALCGAEAAGVHLYLGTTAWWQIAPSDLRGGLFDPARRWRRDGCDVPGLAGRGPRDPTVRWLIVSDAALDMAAGRPFRTDTPEGWELAPAPPESWQPETLGVVRLRTDEPITARAVGNLYLVEVSAPPDPPKPEGRSRKVDRDADRQAGEPRNHAG